MRQHGMNAGERSRLCHVNPSNPRMSVRAEQDFPDQHARHVVIVGEFGFTGDQFDGIHFWMRLIDDRQRRVLRHCVRVADFALNVGHNRFNRFFITGIAIKVANNRLAYFLFGRVRVGV